MSMFRIVDRGGRMVADADNLDGLTKSCTQRSACR